MSAQARRGQAIVEATLGILVFVSVLVWGLHLAEVTVTQMKVTEAAQAAVWDSTSGEMHVLPSLTSPFPNFNGATNNVNTAEATTNGRYRNFDGRASVAGNPAPKGLFSSAVANSLVVNCGMDRGLDRPAGNAGFLLHEALIYRDNNGMGCEAIAMIDPMGTMKVGRFLEDANGFFGNTAGAKTSGSQAQSVGYKVCAVGRPNGFNGNCQGSFDMMLDDWGLAGGGSEDSQCPGLPYGFPCVGGNTNFWMSANLLYQLNSLVGTQNRAEYNLVKDVVAQPPVWAWPGIPFLPGNPTSFMLAFMGEDTLFIQPTMPGDLSWPAWFTSPYGLFFPSHTVAHLTSGDCYLGKNPCNTGLISDP